MKNEPYYRLGAGAEGIATVVDAVKRRVVRTEPDLTAFLWHRMGWGADYSTLFGAGTEALAKANSVTLGSNNDVAPATTVNELRAKWQSEAKGSGPDYRKMPYFVGGFYPTTQEATVAMALFSDGDAVALSAAGELFLRDQSTVPRQIRKYPCVSTLSHCFLRPFGNRLLVCLGSQQALHLLSKSGADLGTNVALAGQAQDRFTAATVDPQHYMWVARSDGALFNLFPDLGLASQFKYSPHATNNTINHLAVTNDGLLAVATAMGKISLLEPTGREICSWYSDSRGLVPLPGDRLLTVEDSVAKIWSRAGAVLKTIPITPPGGTAICLPGGGGFAIAHGTGRVSVYGNDGNDLNRGFYGHRDTIVELAISADHQRGHFMARDGQTMRLWRYE